MKTYDEITREEILDPDLDAGCLYEGTIVTGRTEERTVVLSGSKFRHVIPAEDIIEPCQWYHKYDETDLENTINSKISELSSICNQTIYAGMTIQLSDGSQKLFSYNDKDQANYTQMFLAVVLGATSYSYHENDGNCTMYSAADIMTIYSAMSDMKTSQLTYFNQLKHYVKTLRSVKDVQAVTYGQELTGEYLERYNDIIQETKEQNLLVLSNLSKVRGNAT